jgi:hypothetical protein
MSYHGIFQGILEVDYEITKDQNHSRKEMLKLHNRDTLDNKITIKTFFLTYFYLCIFF